MDLHSLIRDCPSVRLERPAVVVGATEIAAIAEDSREVTAGTLFIARGGTRTDGDSFLPQAIARGAAAVLVRPGRSVPAGPAVLVADDPARAGALLAESLHGFPSRRLRLVAVTGTNGKTTVAFLVRQLCAAAGLRCGLSGTVLVDDGRHETPARLTTLPAWELSALLARMVDNGCEAAAIEASSHALDQGRLAGVEAAVGIFTNLSGDHLDYHGSMEAYADAKARLFAGLAPTATAIVNAGDPHAARMIRDCRARIVRCSLGPPATPGDAATDCSAEILDAGATGSRLRLCLGEHEQTLTIPLVGAHNAMNAVEAAAAAVAIGIDPWRVVAALESVGAPPGRLEPVTAPEASFSVLVDYAHTDDALESVLRALRPLVPPADGRLVVIFGCGGDRDRTKRPRMAAVACRYADRVIVTSDNPRTESPDAIIDEIMGGVPLAATAIVRREVDRSRAIALAISEARAGDVILIAGKGHETEQIVGLERRTFDDRLEAAAALASRAPVSR